MNPYSLFRSAQPPGPESGRRGRAANAIIDDAAEQQGSNVVQFPTGASPNSPSSVKWAGLNHNYNETVKETRRGSELQLHPDNAGIGQIHADSRRWLAEAEILLDECFICAEEDELPSPSSAAIARSRELLQEFSVCITSRPDIYPMDEAGVAIDFRSSDGKSGVLFVVDQDGSGIMFHCTEGVRGRVRVKDAKQLIDEGAIANLERVGIR